MCRCFRGGAIARMNCEMRHPDVAEAITTPSPAPRSKRSPVPARPRDSDRGLAAARRRRPLASAFRRQRSRARWPRGERSSLRPRTGAPLMSGFQQPAQRLLRRVGGCSARAPAGGHARGRRRALARCSRFWRVGLRALKASASHCSRDPSFSGSGVPAVGAGRWSLRQGYCRPESQAGWRWRG